MPYEPFPYKRGKPARNNQQLIEKKILKKINLKRSSADIRDIDWRTAKTFLLQKDILYVELDEGICVIKTKVNIPMLLFLFELSKGLDINMPKSRLIFVKTSQHSALLHSIQTISTKQTFPQILSFFNTPYLLLLQYKPTISFDQLTPTQTNQVFQLKKGGRDRFNQIGIQIVYGLLIGQRRVQVLMEVGFSVQRIIKSPVKLSQTLFQPFPPESFISEFLTPSYLFIQKLYHNQREQIFEGWIKNLKGKFNQKDYELSSYHIQQIYIGMIVAVKNIVKWGYEFVKQCYQGIVLEQKYNLGNLWGVWIQGIDLQEFEQHIQKFILMHQKYEHLQKFIDTLTLGQFSVDSNSIQKSSIQKQTLNVNQSQLKSIIKSVQIQDNQKNIEQSHILQKHNIYSHNNDSYLDNNNLPKTQTIRNLPKTQTNKPILPKTQTIRNKPILPKTQNIRNYQHRQLAYQNQNISDQSLYNSRLNRESDIEQLSQHSQRSQNIIDKEPQKSVFIPFKESLPSYQKKSTMIRKDSTMIRKDQPSYQKKSTMIRKDQPSYQKKSTMIRKDQPQYQKKSTMIRKDKEDNCVEQKKQLDRKYINDKLRQFKQRNCK